MTRSCGWAKHSYSAYLPVVDSGAAQPLLKSRMPEDRASVGSMVWASQTCGTSSEGHLTVYQKLKTSGIKFLTDGFGVTAQAIACAWSAVSHFLLDHVALMRASLSPRR